MQLRRRTGATLGLVAICILVIALLGIGAYFLAKIMGGGREIANATDAGVLNVAKHAIRDARVATPAGYEDCEYPLGCGYINLLTYNRCVARAIMVASNATTMTGNGSYTANAQRALEDLEAAGQALKQQILDANKYFNQVSNSTHMASLTGVKDSGPCIPAFMKPSASTNVFFTAGQVSGIDVPISSGDIAPKAPTAYSSAAQRYMAGYSPIAALGKTIYGVPVFPQQNPHLVSFLDFSASKNAFGSAPPNAVQVGGDTKEMKTGLMTGAVACAIVGATEVGSAGSGGTNIGTTLLGSGFQFPAAASYGYIEFGNYPANNAPPGYEPMDYKDNIFNNELYTEANFLAMGNVPGASENSTKLAFGIHSNDVLALVEWAEKETIARNNQAANAQNPDPNAPRLPVDHPPAPNTTTPVYAGDRGAVTMIPPGGVPNDDQRRALNACKIMEPSTLVHERNLLGLIAQNVCWCTEQLQDEAGLSGACVAALADMQRVYDHNIPHPNAGGSQDFSQADWAKAKLLTEFEGVNPKNPGGYTNYAEVNLTPEPSSGLGIYAEEIVPGRVPAIVPNMPAPPAVLPLQRPGTIFQLIRAVQAPDCMSETIASITKRCKQIQPKTTDADVLRLLNSREALLPMASHGGAPTWTNARKLYIYLPDGDLSKSLCVSSTEPPKITHRMPDGCCASPMLSVPCYSNRYSLNGTIVDSEKDQNVEFRPYVQIDGDLHVIDHADWQPGTGADNNFGRMTFQEIGVGKSNYKQIN